jgi:hypothetical protein
MKRFICALALVVFTAAPALADPKSDLMAAMVGMTKATSYHMSISGRGHTMEADVAQPGKMHVIASQFEMIKIDSTMWMKMNGKWQQLNIPGMGEQMTGAVMQAMAMAHASPEDVTVSDLGMKSPLGGGPPMHAYSVTNKAGKSPDMIYVSGGMVAEVDTGDGSIVKLTNYNQPVDIHPPM